MFLHPCIMMELMLRREICAIWCHRVDTFLFAVREECRSCLYFVEWEEVKMHFPPWDIFKTHFQPFRFCVQFIYFSSVFVWHSGLLEVEKHREKPPQSPNRDSKFFKSKSRNNHYFTWTIICWKPVKTTRETLNDHKMTQIIICSLQNNT